MKWLRKLLGDDELIKAIEQQSSKIASLADRVDACLTTQTTGVDSVGSIITENLQTQTAGIENVGTTIKESFSAQTEALGLFTKRLEIGIEQQREELTRVEKGIRDQ